VGGEIIHRFWPLETFGYGQSVAQFPGIFRRRSVAAARNFMNPAWQGNSSYERNKSHYAIYLTLV
jgi:hypothetical protein